MSEENPFIVSADWLQDRLAEPGLSILDASWYLPSHQREAKAEYEAVHIPGAIFFDQELVSDPRSDLPHTLPRPEAFAQYAGSMGVSNADRIVIYDGPGLFSAPRAWWLFRVMGAANVYLLDGGFDRWRRENRPTTDKVTKIAPCLFRATLDADSVASLVDVRSIVAEGGAQIADARPAGRFRGDDPEPRAGLRLGHMPGAMNVPYADLSENGSLLPPERLRTVLAAAGLDLGKSIVTTCGSGVTAAAISLALESVGHRDHKLYDGSWAEWGGRDDVPVATGSR